MLLRDFTLIWAFVKGSLFSGESDSLLLKENTMFSKRTGQVLATYRTDIFEIETPVDLLDRLLAVRIKTAIFGFEGGEEEVVWTKKGDHFKVKTFFGLRPRIFAYLDFHYPAGKLTILEKFGSGISHYTIDNNGVTYGMEYDLNIEYKELKIEAQCLFELLGHCQTEECGL